MSKKTLLQYRIEQRNEAIEDLLERAETLRKCYLGGFSDVAARVRDMEEKLREASSFSSLVADLEDVEKYGPGGGR